MSIKSEVEEYWALFWKLYYDEITLEEFNTRLAQMSDKQLKLEVKDYVCVGKDSDQR